ncbi:MAG: hypothetical protein Q9184_000154 [Pyrenodesmia sp. 2 TL-2023]
MVQLYARTPTDFFIVCASILVHVGARATPGALWSTSSSSLPAPSICDFTSVNHITQTLPQQCLATAWPGKLDQQATTAEDLQDRKDEAVHTVSRQLAHTVTASAPDRHVASPAGGSPSYQQRTETQGFSTVLTANSGGAEPSPRNEDGVPLDADSESPLDNANFLSFEEWKKRNLAKAGQSADNVGGGRSGASEPRRRPGAIHNALDSLGEDTEIEIDFGGFVNPPPADVRHTGEKSSPESRGPVGDKADKTPGTQLSKAHSRSKDAGITCKERSNYASFDCASTILKTNPECKSATSVLVENKDSYLLNLCSADNKFFIVELCDDILVDTVVLANYEFFSSIFRTFRVSVSDRYPVKLDRWRDLGTFEGQNSRGIQAFLIEEPQIWARYLRIEFLTHYGHEYYCPVSLLRVHGTTMMEEFNHELKNPKGEEEADEEEQPEESLAVHDVVTANLLKQESKIGPEQTTSPEHSAANNPTPSETVQALMEKLVQAKSTPTRVEPLDCTSPRDNSPIKQLAAVIHAGNTTVQQCSRREAPSEAPTPTSLYVVSQEAKSAKSAQPSSTVVISQQTVLSSKSSISPSEHSSISSSSSVRSDISQSMPNENTTSKKPPASPHSSTKTASSPTHPSPPNPTTQESFFKSVHKRLQLLESNSTLSLQYIEDQSRILRDAFAIVEKRQLAKTNTFLELLNSTVLTEIREFRTQYDQIWQSTVLELSSQRQQSQVEIAALSNRLTLLADELLFQKRIAVMQFLMILVCLALALFSRGSLVGGEYLEHTVNKSSVNLSTYIPQPPDSPTYGSPGSTRPPSRYGFFSRAASSFSHRRSPSEESMGAGPGGRDGRKSPSIACSPPTPTSLSDGGGDEDRSSERNDGTPDSSGAGSPERGHEKGVRRKARGNGTGNRLLSPDAPRANVIISDGTISAAYGSS